MTGLSSATFVCLLCNRAGEYEWIIVMKSLSMICPSKYLLWRCTQIKTYSWDNAQVILVGNKSDMEDERVISYERGKQLADSLGLQFFETSAKENINVRVSEMERPERAMSWLVCAGCVREARGHDLWQDEREPWRRPQHQHQQRDPADRHRPAQQRQLQLLDWAGREDWSGSRVQRGVPRENDYIKSPVKSNFLASKIQGYVMAKRVSEYKLKPLCYFFIRLYNILISLSGGLYCLLILN